MSAADVEAVLDRLGGYGRYQVLFFLGLGLVNVRAAWHVFVSLFVGATPAHHCTPPANHSLNHSLPWAEASDGQMGWAECSMYREPGLSNETTSCQNGWTYVWERDGESSIVSEWDLVCGDDYLSELALTMYMVGATCGTLLLTPLSDRWGRKTLLLACLWLQALVGLAAALVPSVLPFVVLQFFIGLTNMTISLCAYVLIVETFDKDTRELPALSLQFFWAGGLMLLALMAYLIPNWRHLELAVSLPQLLTISYFWLLPESPTWLLVKGKVKRARAVILTILRVNKLPPIDDLDKTLALFHEGLPALEKKIAAPDTCEGGASQKPSQHDVTVTSQQEDLAPISVLDLFKTPRIRRYAFFMFYLYLVNSLAYFGISFSTPMLSGNKYINTFISGAVEVPAYFICIVSNRRVGRRLPICVFLVVCAAANVAVIFTPTETGAGTDLSAVRTVLVMIGKFGITGSYSALYLYGSEVFPTSIRNHAVGLCSFFENIGSISAPQIVYASRSLTQLPMTLFAAMTLLGAVLVIFLPETHKKPLPQTIRDVEGWRNENREPKPDKSDSDVKVYSVKL